MKSSKFKKKYKALILDVDGTTIALRRDAQPTSKVKEAINKAQKKVFVGLATSRPYFMLKHIISHLDLSGPSIINGGAYIIDSTSGNILWKKIISEKDIRAVKKAADRVGVKISLTDREKDLEFSEYETKKREIPTIWADTLDKAQAEKFRDIVSAIPTISTLMTPSWTTGNVAMIITHAEATKQHGILEVAKMLNISTHEIIGVGDGYNDFPLLMACGLKIAMGNAVPDLKEIADYIAPTVEEDGVAHIIERFIL